MIIVPGLDTRNSPIENFNAAYTGFTGVNIVYKLNPDKTTATVPTIKPIVIQKSAWLDKAYFFPIMRSEINKNNLLVQNPGY